MYEMCYTNKLALPCLKIMKSEFKTGGNPAIDGNLSYRRRTFVCETRELMAVDGGHLWRLMRITSLSSHSTSATASVSELSCLVLEPCFAKMQ